MKGDSHPNSVSSSLSMLNCDGDIQGHVTMYASLPDIPVSNSSLSEEGFLHSPSDSLLKRNTFKTTLESERLETSATPSYGPHLYTPSRRKRHLKPQPKIFEANSIKRSSSEDKSIYKCNPQHISSTSYKMKKADNTFEQRNNDSFVAGSNNALDEVPDEPPPSYDINQLTMHYTSSIDTTTGQSYPSKSDTSTEEASRGSHLRNSFQSERDHVLMAPMAKSTTEAVTTSSKSSENVSSGEEFGGKCSFKRKVKSEDVQISPPLYQPDLDLLSSQQSEIPKEESQKIPNQREQSSKLGQESRDLSPELIQDVALPLSGPCDDSEAQNGQNLQLASQKASQSLSTQSSQTQLPPSLKSTDNNQSDKSLKEKSLKKLGRMLGHEYCIIHGLSFLTKVPLQSFNKGAARVAKYMLC